MKKEIAQTILQLLNRVEIKGSEVFAFIQCVNVLNSIANPQEAEEVKPQKKEEKKS